MSEDGGQLGFEDGAWQPTGRYSGPDPTRTEKESGDAVEARDHGPLRPGGACASVLWAFSDGRRRTAYDASKIVSGDPHAKRRETKRLEARGFLRKDGELPNCATAGRDAVDAFVLTAAGRNELDRLRGGTT